MSSPRDAIRLTEDELASLLDEVGTFALATNGPDGFPHVTAMWFAMVDGRISFWTYRKAQKTRNLRRDPRLSCLFEAGTRYDELRGAMVKGHAELFDDYDTALRIGTAVARRYHPEITVEAAEAIAARQAAKRTGVQVLPVTVASWDHRKLGRT